MIRPTGASTHSTKTQIQLFWLLYLHTGFFIPLYVSFVGGKCLQLQWHLNFSATPGLCIPVVIGCLD